MMKFLILKIQNSNLKIVYYGKIWLFLLCLFYYKLFIENDIDNDSYRNWIKKFILNDGYDFFIKAFIKELKEICNKRNDEENIDIVCVKLLIKIIKNIYLDSIESNN